MADYIADLMTRIYKAACHMVCRLWFLVQVAAYDRLNLSDNLKICQRDDGSLPLSTPAVIARYVRALYRSYISQRGG